MHRIAYTVKQDKFEGPLEVLLELIQGEKLSINEISLAKVTDDFISHLKQLQAEGQADSPSQVSQNEIWEGKEVLAEFLVVAATLLLIKSRSLLPQFQASAEGEASIDELEKRLAEYQRMKELSQELGRLARGGPKSFSREAYAGRTALFYPPPKFSIAMLGEAFRRAVEALPKTVKLAEEKIKKIISLEEKIKELQAFLQAKVERAFSELVAGAREKVEVIVSFLALLELAKQKLVTAQQKRLFGEITIKRP